MADTYWSGATSGAWSTSGNWTNGVPGAGDRAIFPRTATQSVTSGLDQNTIDLAVLSTEDGFAGDIGSSGSPLIIGATKLKIYGSGRVYFQNSHASTEYIHVDSPNKVDALTLSGAAVYLAAVHRGKMVVSSGMSGITNLHVMYVSAPNSDAAVSVVDSTISLLWQVAGTTSFGGAVTTALVAGGTATFTGAGSGNTTLSICNNAIVKYEATGGMTNAYVLGGLLDFTTTDNVQSVGNAWVHPAGRLKYDPDLVTITPVIFTDEIGYGPVP